MQKFVLFCERYGIALVPICLILLGCGLWPEMELLVPSLPDMKRAFDVQDSHIQQLMTVNFFGFLIGVLLAGPICDSLGRKKVLVVGALAYLLSSLVSALAGSFSILMIARFFQGFTMTGPVIAGGVLLLEVTSGAKQVFWMSFSGSMITFCMALAPIVGSWVNNSFGFQGNLWSIVGLGVIGILPSFFFTSETLKKEDRKPFHLSLLFKGYLRLLKNWRFLCVSIPMCALAAAYWIYVGVSALYMVDHLGILSSEFGRYQGPIVGCFSVISLSASRLLTRFGLIRCIKGGVVLMLIGCGLLLGMSILTLDHAFWTTVFMMIFVGGMAPVCSLLYPYSVSHLPSDLQGSAQAMINAIRLFVTSLGTFCLGFMYSGPLFPVALMLFIILLMSCFFLWKGREFFAEDITHVAGGGH